MNAPSDVKDVVRQKYGAAATRVAQGKSNACCGASAGDCAGGDPITSNLYDALQADAVPEKALLASLGCGNPTALAELKPGETVLDLGSGGGIDVLLSAKRVGPTGKAFGLDMTDAMLALAEENKQKSGLANVHFLKGEIENIPLPDNSVDVIISNCVINLSADKDRVIREAFRVLKPGGRFAVSDVVVRGEVPAAIRKSVELWVGCVAGALSYDDYLAKLSRVGFENAAIEVTRVYKVEDAREFLAVQDVDAEAIAHEVDGKFVSGFVRATKPVRATAGTKRFHVHAHVENLQASIAFYSKLFGAAPTRTESDYAKWMLEDPRINFAISTRGGKPGIDHLGFQTDTEEELAELKARATAADMALLDEGQTTCCYARSDKYWITDPQGIAWEQFHTLGNIPVFSEKAAEPAPAQSACCAEPKPRGKPIGITVKASSGGCCS